MRTTTLACGLALCIVAGSAAGQAVPTIVAQLGTGPLGGTDQGCEVTSGHTTSSFEGGSYHAQAGFIEQEVAAISFTLPASAFPLKVLTTECIFATESSIITTTTKWSMIVYAGTPQNGAAVEVASSNGKELPHAVIPPGTNGVNIMVVGDTTEPIVVNDNGSHTFSVGYRVDDHNLQSGNGCAAPPDPRFNAFPATDLDGVQSSGGNWLRAFECGPLGCPSGWHSFSGMLSVCRPTGDWMIRVKWESLSCSTPCYPDCNGDTNLDLADFGCFTTKFALGDLYADCNADGVRNLSDFGCFTTKFALGCP